VKLDLDFPELARLKREMGAPDVVWRPGEPPQGRGSGKAEPVDVDTGTLPGRGDGVLVEDGRQVVVYIKDVNKPRYLLERQPEEAVRFHLVNCTTLDEMRAKGRIQRYVVTNRTDGMFRVHWHDRDTGQRGETEAALKVCMNCLKALDYQGYAGGGLSKSQRKAIWSAFDLAAFFAEYSTFFPDPPLRNATDVTISGYTKDWQQISQRQRKAAGWTCERCRVDLRAAPHLLHCHHRNGVKTDNSRANLAVLCILCHAGEPGHEQMHVSRAASRAVLDARKAQNLSG
jgi:hypothetical protein